MAIKETDKTYQWDEDTDQQVFTTWAEARDQLKEEIVPEGAYDPSWASDLNAPTKKDVYDKVETIGGGTGHDPVTLLSGTDTLSLNGQEISVDALVEELANLTPEQKAIIGFDDTGALETKTSLAVDIVLADEDPAVDGQITQDATNHGIKIQVGGTVYPINGEGGGGTGVIVQVDDPDENSAVGIYCATGSGHSFYKSDEGLFNFHLGTYTVDPVATYTLSATDPGNADAIHCDDTDLSDILDCGDGGTDCSVAAPQGATISNVTAIPATGREFVSWGGDLSGSTNPAEITLDGNKAITATFQVVATGYSDDFTNADDTLLPVHNPEWEHIYESVAGATLKILDNCVRVSGDRTVAAIYKASDSDTSQVVAKGVPAATTTSIQKAPTVRGSDPNSDANGSYYYGYLSDLDGTNWTRVSLSRRVLGSSTLLKQETELTDTYDQTADHTVKLVASGTSPVNLKLYVDGNLELEYDDNDGSEIASGKPGIGLKASSTYQDSKTDDWQDH